MSTKPQLHLADKAHAPIASAPSGDTDALPDTEIAGESAEPSVSHGPEAADRDAFDANKFGRIQFSSQFFKELITTPLPEVPEEDLCRTNPPGQSPQDQATQPSSRSRGEGRFGKGKIGSETAQIHEAVDRDARRAFAEAIAGTEEAKRVRRRAFVQNGVVATLLLGGAASAGFFLAKGSATPASEHGSATAPDSPQQLPPLEERGAPTVSALRAAGPAEAVASAAAAPESSASAPPVAPAAPSESARGAAPTLALPAKSSKSRVPAKVAAPAVEHAPASQTSASPAPASQTSASASKRWFSSK